MAFCGNCGKEVLNNNKFCPECGAQVIGKDGEENIVNQTPTPDSNNKEINNYIISNGQANTPTKKPIWDRLGWLYAIALFIIALINIGSKAAFLTIGLSIAIILCGIFCLVKKYRGRVFTVLAVVLAMLCIATSVKQAGEIGYFSNPDKQKEVAKDEENKVASVVTSTSKEETKTSVKNETKEEPTKESIETKTESDTKSSETSTSEETVSSTENDTQEVKEEKSQGGVDPDLKEFLDSYEAFIDEYVDFMKKYNSDSGNAVTMLADYSKIMTKYMDFTAKVEKYDSETMSVEDQKYYLEVINRCNQKMLEIY